MEHMADDIVDNVHNVTADFYRNINRVLPRYFRISGNLTSLSESEYIARFEELYEKGLHDLKPLKWLPGYLSLPAYINFADMGGLKAASGLGVYPMDASSGVPVVLLAMESPKTVLDLCCCPGDAVVVGVDVSEHRMKTCRALVKKHQDFLVKSASGGNSSPRCLLFLADGTSFGRDWGNSACAQDLDQKPRRELVFDSAVYALEQSERGSRRSMNKSARKREKRRLSNSQTMPSSVENEFSPYPTPLLLSSSGRGFDVVLVDAQCTHDGSYKHMETPDSSLEDAGEGCGRDDVSMSTASLRVKKRRRLDSSEVENESVCALQRRLLRNGFDRTRRGGRLIYSTCSSQLAQGEDVVRWLLEELPMEARVEPIAWDEVRSCASVQTWERAVDGWTKKHPDVSTAEQVSVDLAPVQVFEEVDRIIAELNVCSKSSESDSTLTNLAQRLSTVVSSSLIAPLERSASLTGSVRMSFCGGMSGLFVAVIRKL